MRIVRAHTEEYEDYFDLEAIQDALTLMGFAYLEMNFYRRLDPNEDIVFYAELFDDGLIVDYYENNQREDTTTITKATDLITFVEDKLKAKGIENVKIVQADELDMLDTGISPRSVMAAKKRKKHGKRKHGKRGKSQTQPSTPSQSYATPSMPGKSASRQKTSTRDFAAKLKQVRSSNVWAYAFNPKNEQVGDLLMQFKNKNGGPGDVYIYYDVPNKIWHRLAVAESKGHAFWQLIRHKYTYAKLTGDKRTKLPNGI